MNYFNEIKKDLEYFRITKEDYKNIIEKFTFFANDLKRVLNIKNVTIFVKKYDVLIIRTFCYRFFKHKLLFNDSESEILANLIVRIHAKYANFCKLLFNIPEKNTIKYANQTKDHKIKNKIFIYKIA